MPTHCIRTSNVWVECVKLYWIVILSLSRQLSGTSRGLLQLCLPDKHLAMSFLPEGHVSLYLHLLRCLWWPILFGSIQDWATQPVCHPSLFPLKLSHHTSNSEQLCLQEGRTNKTKSHHAFANTMTEHVNEVGANSDLVCGVTFLTLWNHLLGVQGSMRCHESITSAPWFMETWSDLIFKLPRGALINAW